MFRLILKLGQGGSLLYLAGWSRHLCLR